jgi:hypothetical protein
MALRIVKLDQVPKRRRRAVPRIMRIPEWAQALEKMSVGIGLTEAIVITLTPEELAKYRISNIKAAARPIRQHIETHGLHYIVSAKYTSEGGTIVIARGSKKARQRVLIAGQ